MILTFLEGTGLAKRLAKTFTKKEDGSIEKSSYPNARKVTSSTAEVNSIYDFANAIKENATQGRALFTSGVTRPLRKESRSGMATATSTTEWMCLDFDDAPYASVEEFIDEVPYLKHVSYIVAYSASHGFKPGLNAHVFFLLDTPAYYSELKMLLTGINWQNETLRTAMTLSDSRMSLRRCLDTAGVRKAALIYLAPPVLNGGIQDPFPSLDDRFVVVDKEHERLNLAVFPDQWRNSAFFLHDLEEYTDELRATFGLEPLKKARGIREINGMDMEYLALPPTSVITKAPGALHENGLVRCNVNGGDSNAYFFEFGVITADTLMYNFKDEDPFLLQQADPAFAAAWNEWYIQQKQEQLVLPDWLLAYQVQQPFVEEPPKEEKTAPSLAVPELLEEALPVSPIVPGRVHPDGHFIFRDRMQDEHFEYRRRKDGTVLLAPLKATSAKTQAKVLGIKYNKEKGFPTMTTTYDVAESRVIYEDNGEMVINTYTKPAVIQYLADDKRDLSPAAALATMKERTPAYYQTILQALGSSEAAAEHFVNWLSVLFTKPSARVNTAWILRGVHGSGKSSLVETMLHMMVNYGREALDDSVHVIDMALSISSFDDWRYGKKLVLVDEVEVSSSIRTQGGQLVYNWYKTLVTTQRATLNKKGTRLENVKLNTGFIFASNYHDRFYIDPKERRYHVPPFQTRLFSEGVPLAAACATWDEFKQKVVLPEVPTFGEILSRVQADERLAQRVYDEGDLAMMADASKSPLDSLGTWLVKGDFDSLCSAVFDTVDADPSLVDRDPEIEHAMRYLAFVAATRGSTTGRIPTSTVKNLHKAISVNTKITASSLTRRMQQLGLVYLPSAQRIDVGLLDVVGGAPMKKVFNIDWDPDSNFTGAIEHPLIRQYISDMGVKQGARNGANSIPTSVH